MFPNGSKLGNSEFQRTRLNREKLLNQVGEPSGLRFQDLYNFVILSAARTGVPGDPDVGSLG